MSSPTPTFNVVPPRVSLPSLKPLANVTPSPRSLKLHNESQLPSSPPNGGHPMIIRLKIIFTSLNISILLMPTHMMIMPNTPALPKLKSVLIWGKVMTLMLFLTTPPGFLFAPNPISSIAWYKACLMAKGFHRHPGVDFHEAFSPVV